MSEHAGYRTTTDELLAGRRLTGQRVLVTGVSAGLGVETARALAAHGAEVVGAARDLGKAQRSTEQVRSQAAHGGSLALVELDLASLASVRACADNLKTEGKPFDLVIANAGVMMCPPSRTADGFDMQFGTNHLGHFVLVNRIASLMKPGSRLVNLSSNGHRYADVDLDDPNFDKTEYDPAIAYGRSKTANILFAVEFDRRHRDRGVRATAVNPGGVKTELSRHLPGDGYDTSLAAFNALLAQQGKPPVQFKTLRQGAATTIWAAAVAPAEEVAGKYCDDCHVVTRAATKGDHALFEGVAGYALDPAHAAELWAKSEEMVGEVF